MSLRDPYTSSIVLLVFSAIWLLTVPLDAQQESCPVSHLDCCDCPEHVGVSFSQVHDDHIVRGEPGDTISIHCDRICGTNFIERWLIQLWNDSKIIKNYPEEFKGATLSTNSSICRNQTIQYSLHIQNISMDINGLIIDCGVRSLHNNQEWYAPYSIQLLLVHNSITELTSTVSSARRDLNIKTDELNTLNNSIAELTSTLASVRRDLNVTTDELNTCRQQLQSNLSTTEKLLLSFGLLITVALFALVVVLIIGIYCMFERRSNRINNIKTQCICSESCSCRKR